MACPTRSSEWTSPSRSRFARVKAKNPFGQIPVIDDDGVIVSESGAILLYLGRKSGALMPRDLAGEAQVLRWSVAALNTIEMPLLALWFVDMSGGKAPKPSEALHRWSEQRLGQLDGWLATGSSSRPKSSRRRHPDDARSRGGTDQNLLKPYANILAYRERCTERQAWKRTFRRRS